MVHPSGQFLYVSDDGTNMVKAFVITLNGSLSEISGSPFPAAGAINPQCLAIDPSGRFLYATNYTSNTISAFTVDSSTGALTPVAGSPFAAGTQPCHSQ